MRKNEPALLILSRGKPFLVLFWFFAIFAFALMVSAGYDIHALGPIKIILLWLVVALDLFLYVAIFMAVGIIFTDDKHRLLDYLLLVTWPLSTIWACYIYRKQYNLYE